MGWAESHYVDIYDPGIGAHGPTPPPWGRRNGLDGPPPPSERCAAAHALQRAYCLLAEASVENPPKVLQDLSEPDSSNQEEKNDLGAGSDVGCAALTETPALAPGESSLGAAEERFHVRSVNEALAVVTPMLVDSEVASAAKAEALRA